MTSPKRIVLFFLFFFLLTFLLFIVIAHLDYARFSWHNMGDELIFSLATAAGSSLIFWLVNKELLDLNGKQFRKD